MGVLLLLPSLRVSSFLLILAISSTLLFFLSLHVNSYVYYRPYLPFFSLLYCYYYRFALLSFILSYYCLFLPNTPWVLTCYYRLILAFFLFFISFICILMLVLAISSILYTFYSILLLSLRVYSYVITGYIYHYFYSLFVFYLYCYINIGYIYHSFICIIILLLVLLLFYSFFSFYYCISIGYIYLSFSSNYHFV